MKGQKTPGAEFQKAQLMKRDITELLTSLFTSENGEECPGN